MGKPPCQRWHKLSEFPFKEMHRADATFSQCGCNHYYDFQLVHVLCVYTHWQLSVSCMSAMAYSALKPCDK